MANIIFANIVNESSSSKRKKLDAFPIILHRILSDPRFGDIITWAPHGCAWKILNKDHFLHEVVPKFFHLKLFKSFIRQVNIWGFIRITKGDDKGSYYHEVSTVKKSNLIKINYSKMHLVISSRKARTYYAF